MNGVFKRNQKGEAERIGNTGWKFPFFSRHSWSNRGSLHSDPKRVREMWLFSVLTLFGIHKLEGHLYGLLMARYFSADVVALGRLLVRPLSWLV